MELDCVVPGHILIYANYFETSLTNVGTLQCAPCARQNCKTYITLKPDLNLSDQSLRLFLLVCPLYTLMIYSPFFTSKRLLYAVKRLIIFLHKNS